MIPILAMKYESYIFCTLDMTMLLVSDYPKTVYLCGLFPRNYFPIVFYFLLVMKLHEYI